MGNSREERTCGEQEQARLELSLCLSLLHLLKQKIFLFPPFFWFFFPSSWRSCNSQREHRMDIYLFFRGKNLFFLDCFLLFFSQKNRKCLRRGAGISLSFGEGVFLFAGELLGRGTEAAPRLLCFLLSSSIRTLFLQPFHSSPSGAKD